LDDGLDVLDADQDVLWLEVGVNNVALLVEVVEPEEDLLGDLLDDVRRDASMLVAFDEAEQVLAQDFEHHADVRAVGTDVTEVVEQLDDVSTTGMVGIGGDEALEQLDLVEGSFGVVSVRLDDLESDVTFNPIN
jgi:hypothetical protein